MTLITYIINICFIFFLLFLGRISGNQVINNDYIALNGKTMGTKWEIILLKQEIYKKKYIKNIIQNQLYQDERIFSSWKKTSKISDFNKCKKNILYPINISMKNIIFKILHIGEITNGALDITIHPLIKMWGFEKKKIILPISKKKIKKKLSLTGLQNIHILQNNNHYYLIKKIKKLKINLSTVGEGLAIDHISNLLEKENISNYLISVGGSVLVKGYPKNIGIKDPTDKKNTINMILSLHNVAISTSGSYYNYYNYHKKNISHIINPFTGNPIKHNLVSVSVISQNALYADIWDTGFMVLGFHKSKKIIITKKLSVCLIVKKHNKIFNWLSPEFKKLLI